MNELLPQSPAQKDIRFILILLPYIFFRVDDCLGNNDDSWDCSLCLSYKSRLITNANLNRFRYLHGIQTILSKMVWNLFNGYTFFWDTLYNVSQPAHDLLTTHLLLTAQDLSIAHAVLTAHIQQITHVVMTTHV